MTGHDLNQILASLQNFCSQSLWLVFLYKTDTVIVDEKMKTQVCIVFITRKK